jgi:hypothetical protein
MAPSSNSNVSTLDIDEKDLMLIERIRSELVDELKLVPGYDTNLNLMRWIIGWNRQIGLFCLIN